MTTVVLDTNVLVSALFNPHGPSSQILNLILSNTIMVCLDERIRYEYREVLLRDKFGFDPKAVDDLIDFFDQEGLYITATPFAWQWPDHADAKFLEVAVAAQAGYLITGNLKHYPANTIKHLKIIAPARFLGI